jgi:ligand-binding SRPBCC domain-containing protein
VTPEREIRREGDGYVLRQEQVLEAPREEVFPFFADPGNLEAITPDRLRFRITEAPERMAPGARIRYRLRLHGVPVSWTSRIAAWDPPTSFADVQGAGPYRRWEHVHAFVPEGDGTRVVDRVRYALPMGPLGRLAHPVVRRDLHAIFEHRADVLAERFGED